VPPTLHCKGLKGKGLGSGAYPASRKNLEDERFIMQEGILYERMKK